MPRGPGHFNNRQTSGLGHIEMFTMLFPESWHQDMIASFPSQAITGNWEGGREEVVTSSFSWGGVQVPLPFSLRQHPNQELAPNGPCVIATSSHIRFWDSASDIKNQSMAIRTASCQAPWSPECLDAYNELGADSLHGETCTTGLLGSSPAVPIQALTHSPAVWEDSPGCEHTCTSPSGYSLTFQMQWNLEVAHVYTHTDRHAYTYTYRHRHHIYIYTQIHTHTHVHTYFQT